MQRLAFAVDPRFAGPLAGGSRHCPSTRILPLGGQRSGKAASVGVHERRSASASLDLRRESLRQESASSNDSHSPSIPASRGPSPAARVTIPRREYSPSGG